MTEDTDAIHQLARYVCAGPGAVPPDVRRYATLLLCDQLACQIAGSARELPRRAREGATPSRRPDSATVVGSALRLAPDTAALLNAVSGRSNECDDIHLATTTRPGAVVIPAALAVAEHVGASGADLLDAIIVGYEVMLRASYARVPGLTGPGHQRAPAVETLGAAAASARLCGRGRDIDVATALGVAPGHAAQLLDQARSADSVKRLRWAIPAQAGVRSALLACAGVGGSSPVFSGTTRRDSLASGPSRSFLLSETSIRTYGCADLIYPVLKAFVWLTAAAGLRPAEILSIELFTPDRSIVDQIGVVKHPSDVPAARCSLSFSLAMLLSGRGSCWDDYRAVDLADPDLNALAARISLAVEARDTPRFVTGFRVVVRLTGGREIALRVGHEPDEPRPTVGPTVVEAKFLEFAGDVLGRARAVELFATLQSIDKVRDIRLLGPLLDIRGTPGPPVPVVRTRRRAAGRGAGPHRSRVARPTSAFASRSKSAPDSIWGTVRTCWKPRSR
jgi:2-methylcitrate dehydratase PrpD